LKKWKTQRGTRSINRISAHLRSPHSSFRGRSSTLDIQQGALQDWHGPRRLTAQGQTTRQVFPQTILTQSSMKKKPVITPMKTHENPKFAAQIAQPCTQVPGLTNRCAASGKISGAVSSMKYGDAKDPRRNKLRIFAGRSGRTAESVFFFLLLANCIPLRPPKCTTYPCAGPGRHACLILSYASLG
jgi:hypothetical protein